jgi:RND family efflux transporter MFP subunit
MGCLRSVLARLLQICGSMDQVSHATQVGSVADAETLDRSVTRRAAKRPRIHVRKKQAILALVSFAAIAVAGTVAYRAVTGPVSVRVGAAEISTVREETIGPGTVQSRYAVSLGSRAVGTLHRVLVDVGEEVKEGQLLATLEPTELEARLRAARGAVASAQQDVALARANLAKARSDLELARIKNDRAQNLVAPGAIPVEQADEARGALAVGEANQRAALAAVDARQAALARLVQEARIAETILSYTEIRSPMDGVITRRALEPGSAVAPGAVVFQIVDADALWVATLIDQSLAGRVTVGQLARIRLRSGADLSGHVARIALEADPVTRELEVDVAFDARPARFAINEEADVTIRGEQAQGVTVPLAAVSDRPDGPEVLVVVNGRARRRPIRIGVQGAMRAQVIEGLSEGEPVILTPGAIREGQRITMAGGG